MKKIVFILCMVFLFAGCSQNNAGLPIEESKYEIIAEGQYYRLKKDDTGYCYEILDSSQNTVKSDGLYPKEPKISMLNESIVKVSYQAGTGLSTRWTFYYDAENDKFSPVYDSVFGESGENVVYRKNTSIMVSDIFDSTKYNMTFDTFSHPIAQAADPFIQAEIDESKNLIVISYLTENNFEEITEYFTIPQSCKF